MDSGSAYVFKKNGSTGHWNALNLPHLTEKPVIYLAILYLSLVRWPLLAIGAYDEYDNDN